MALPESQGGIDYPDGGFSAGQGGFPMIGDLGELAARLGSPVTHDRTGSIVFVDSFTFGLSDWQVALSGKGAEVVLVSSPFRSGPFSVKLTAGSDSSRQAKIFRKFPYPQLGKYGLEFSWKPDLYVDRLAVKLVHHDGTNEHEFQFRYVVTDKDLKVRDSDGLYVTIDNDLYLAYTYAPFHTFKLVGNFETDEYVRLIVNEKVYADLPYSAYSFASDDGPNVRVDVTLIGESGHNAFSCVDDIILTQNESLRE